MTGVTCFDGGSLSLGRQWGLRLLRLRWIAGLLLMLSAVTAGAAKVRVVASTSQIGDVLRFVGGDRVTVTVLMGPGVDPHLYKATARDVISLQRADLILYNGLHLEGRLAETFSKIDKLGRTVVAVGDAIPEERLLASAAIEGAHDPHIWFDPGNWSYVVKEVGRALEAADPENAAYYAARTAEYADKVAELSAWAKRRIATVPESKRVLVTSHDAYNYFGRAFGFQVVGVQGISTASEAGLADIARTADFIKERQIPAIFVESSVSPATIERISRDSGAVVGGELYSDAMGALGELHTGADGETYDVGTYFGMFKYNVDTIVTALSR